jgi:hypothetical protein
MTKRCEGFYDDLAINESEDEDEEEEEEDDEDVEEEEEAKRLTWRPNVPVVSA